MGLDIEVDELDTAGGQIARAIPWTGGLGATVVDAAAADEVSTAIAATLSAHLQIIGTHSAHAAQIAANSAAVLQSNAATYREQENLNAAALQRDGGDPGQATPTPAAADPDGSPVTAPTPIPAGISPVDGKAIAALIHTGPGPGPLLSAAEEARAHAEQLRTIATDLRAAIARLTSSWQSLAGEAARDRLTALAGWYDSHADHAIAASSQCTHQAETLGRTRAQVPPPEKFTEIERRLQAASAANASTGGAYARVVTQLQTELATTHSQARVAYARYREHGAALSADPPQAPPSTVRALDNPLAPPGPAVPHPPAPSVPDGTQTGGLAPGASSDPASMLLPPPASAAPPVPDSTRRWVSEMTAALASRPADDPIAVEARRMAYLALHQPKTCDGWEWTSTTGGLAVSTLGTVVTAAGTPAGPADWALLGASLAGTGLAAENLLKCIYQAAAAG
ncbi:hypothetical protein B1790_23825 [Mycobacterium sp. AT1]|nr:hypothetical protein B1790_23825 [Mycobacterium sp. AT1]